MAADNRYKPPTKVRTTSIPYKTMVIRADPDFEREKRRDVFYEMSNGKDFTGNNATSGPYNGSN